MAFLRAQVRNFEWYTFPRLRARSKRSRFQQQSRFYFCFPLHETNRVRAPAISTQCVRERVSIKAALLKMFSLFECPPFVFGQPFCTAHNEGLDSRARACSRRERCAPIWISNDHCNSLLRMHVCIVNTWGGEHHLRERLWGRQQAIIYDRRERFRTGRRRKWFSKFPTMERKTTWCGLDFLHVTCKSQLK